MNLTSSFRARIDPSSTIAILAVGDVLVIAAFVLAGEVSHGFDQPGSVGRIILTLVSFLIGWAIVSIAGSLYTRDAIGTAQHVIFWTLPAWAGAVLIVQVLRATPVVPGEASVTFALVSFAIAGLLLVLWRGLVLFVLTDAHRNRSG